LNTNPANTKTIVIVAYACDVLAGSEPGAGGRIALAAAKTASVNKAHCFVLTRAKHVADFDAQLRDGGLDSCATVVGLRAPRVAEKFFRDGSRLHALCWQFVSHRFLRRIRRTTSDLVAHHVTFASDVLPSAVHLPGLSGVRKIWGPVGSSDARLEAAESASSRVVSALKTHWFRLLGSRVDLVVCQTGHVAKRLAGTTIETVIEQNCIVSPHPGLWERAAGTTPVPSVAVVGVLTERKRPQLAVEALRKTGEGRWNLIMIGDGPLREMLEEAHGDLISAGLLKITGWLPREEARIEVEKCVGLIHPSVREGAPWAIAEALTQGKWVATVAGNGADYLVSTVQYGGAVVANSARESGADLGSAVIKLLDHGRRPAAGSRWAAERFDDVLSSWYWPAD
jgi:glycosyltransferase involved in cell wall biosynthesis